MKFRSQVYTAVSGSVGGLTFSHNRGGMYTRGRATPTNPNTAAQQAARNALSALASAWGLVLTPAQRLAWTTYAENTTVVDAFGEPLVLTGQQMYIRCNTPRLRAGVARVDDGPTTNGNADLSTLTLSYSTPTLSLAYNNADYWATVAGGYLFIQTSVPLNRTVNFHRSPYCYLNKVTGSGTPPTSPFTTTSDAKGNVLSGYTFNRIFVRAVASDDIGRLSAAQILQVDLS